MHNLILCQILHKCVNFAHCYTIQPCVPNLYNLHRNLPKCAYCYTLSIIHSLLHHVSVKITFSLVYLLNFSSLTFVLKHNKVETLFSNIWIVCAPCFVLLISTTQVLHHSDRVYYDVSKSSHTINYVGQLHNLCQWYTQINSAKQLSNVATATLVAPNSKIFPPCYILFCILHCCINFVIVFV